MKAFLRTQLYLHILRSLSDNRGFVMSSNQTNQVKKPNQHLENLIKADGFNDLPFWYREFLKDLMFICQQERLNVIYKKVDQLDGYLKALFYVDVIGGTAFDNLFELVKQAEKYAINNNIKKAA